MIAIKPLHVLAVDFGDQHGGEVVINVYSESKCYIATLAKQTLRKTLSPEEQCPVLVEMLTKQILDGIEQSKRMILDREKANMRRKDGD